MRILALTLDGNMTYCSVSPEVRGTRGCNHVGHMEKGQSVEEFIKKMESHKSFSIPEAKAVVSFKRKRAEIAENIEFNLTGVGGHSPSSEYAESIKDLDGGGVNLKLATPVIAPASEGYYANEWGKTQKQIRDVTHGRAAMVYGSSEGIANTNVGRIISIEDADKLEAEHPGQVLIARDPKSFSEACEKWGIDTPREEIYVLTQEERRGGDDYPNDVHQLYRRLYRSNAAYEKDPSSKNALNVQKSYEQLLDNQSMGEEGFRANGYHLKGVSSLLEGKSGLLRHEMTGGVVRHSGRAVITPDENLDYNEARIPMKMAVRMYEPLLRDKLMNEQGMSREEVARYLANLRWANHVPKEDRDFVAGALENSDLKVLLNRQPSLHKASLQAFTPLLSDDNTIKISPSVVKGYNADFDGDTMTAIAINDVYVSQHSLAGVHAENQTMEPGYQQSSLLKPTKDAKLGIVAATSGYRCSNDHVSHRGVFGNIIGYKDDGTSEICGESYAREEAEEIMDYSMPVHDEDRIVSLGQLKVEEILNQHKGSEDDDITSSEFLDKVPADDLNKLGQLGFQMAPYFSSEIHDKALLTAHAEYHGSLEQQWAQDGIAGNISAYTALNDTIGEVMTTDGPKIIDANYRDGLSREDLFNKSFTSRRAAVAKTVNVAKPGYTARLLFYGLSNVTVQDGSCGNSEKDILSCQAAGGVCADCTGEASKNTYIGGMASTNLSEPGTQLSMREFHTGGTGVTNASDVLNRTFSAWSSSPIIESATAQETTAGRRKAIYDGLKEEYQKHGVKIDDVNLKIVARQMTSFKRDKNGVRPIREGEVADVISMKAIGSSNNPLKSAAMERAYRNLAGKEQEFELDTRDSASFLISL